MEYYRSNQKGQSIIELLITMALMAILIPVLATSMASTREGRAQSDQRLMASLMLQETNEAVLAIKEKDWAEVENNGIFHPIIVDSFWHLENGEENIDSLTRKVTIGSVYRDSQGKIVEIGGTLDPSTKKIIDTVSWNRPYASSLTSVMYISRYRTENFIDTTEANFNNGTKTNTTVTKTNDGEVILGAGGMGDWCSPNLTISAIDLPKSGVANAVSAIFGKVFAGTGDNAAGVSFANVAISNDATPSGNIEGTFDGYKTNGVFGESNYAYLATDNNGKEVVIIDLTNKDANGKYLETGHFDAPGNKSGKSIFVSENVGFVVDENNLYTFDLSQKTGARNQLGSVTLSGNGMSVKVNGNYAYVANDSTDKQLDIVEVKNGGRDLAKVGWAHLNGLGGRDVVINESTTKAYIVTGNSDDKKEFFIVDLSTKTDLRPTLGSFDSDQMDPKAIVLATNNKAVMVGIGGEEYQVIEIGTDTSPSKCGGLNIDTGIHGAATVLEPDGDAFTYIITGDSNAELKIISGGPGGAYATSGIFESRTFDATNSAAFNKFQATITKPTSTDLTFQIGIADAADCNSASYTFVGPDGTSGTYFTTPTSPIPFNDDGAGFENPGRCMRYRAYLSTSDRNQTPVLSDITINYSP